MRRDRGGSSLVEVTVSVVILSLGVLAMAGSTGYVAVQTRAADVNAERAAAVRYVVERMRAERFEEVHPRAYEEAEVVGSFRVWWNVRAVGYALKEIDVHTEGPGYRIGDGWLPAVRETVGTSITRPYP